MSAVKKLVTCSIASILGAIAVYFPMQLTTSENGLRHIAKWEACVSCTYKDSIGINTIGLGATRGADGKPVKDNVTLSDKQVAELFVRDIKINEKCVNERLKGSKMPQQVYDMSVSLIHNNGCEGVTVNKRTGKPTLFAQHMRAGNYAQGCDRMLDFVNAGGKPSKGLINRRTEERLICLNGYPR